MSPAGAAEMLGGIVLVVIVLSDVFRSVVLPRPSLRTLHFGPWVAIGTVRGALRWTHRWPVTRRHGEPAFRAAAARLSGIGFGTTADPEASWRRFSALRAAYAPPLGALCERFGVAGASWGA